MINPCVVPIVLRMLVKNIPDGSLRRIVRIDNLVNCVWLCNIDDDSRPLSMPISLLLEELDPERGNFVIEMEDPYARPRIIAPKEVETATDRLQRERFELITPLLTFENQRLLLHKGPCKRLLDQRAKEVGSTRQRLFNILKLWWKRGMNYQALRPDYANCGIDGKKRKYSASKKLGRPRTIKPGTGVVIIDKNHKILNMAADLYLSNKTKSLQQCIDYICQLHYAQSITDAQGVIINYEVDEDRKPTTRQLQHLIDRDRQPSMVRKKRMGEKYHDLNERGLGGRADGDVQGPGDLFLIDATIADVYLVSQFDRRRIVGRPIIYFVVDAFSSMIVGVYVGFEGPSWIGAMMALVNMAAPKVEFCRQYEIQIKESDWPSHHGCHRLGADKGELMSVPLGMNITKALHIQIENIRSGRPDLKALVERRFGIVPMKWRQFTPGYVEKDFNMRGAKDYRLEAALNLYEFTQLVIYAVLRHNIEPIRDKSMHPAMITDGLTASPIDLWTWGVANLSGSLNVLTVEEVALNVMPTMDARVTRNGIRLYKGGFYSCATAIRDEWFAKARRHEWSITMAFDPRSLDFAYRLDPKLLGGYEVCSLMEPSYDFTGKSLFEVEELALARAKTQAAGENARQSKRIFYDHKSEEIQKRANKAAKEARDPLASKASRTRGIRANRATEKEIQRGPEAFNLSNEPAQPSRLIPHPETPESVKQSSRDLDWLKQQAQGREGG